LCLLPLVSAKAQNTLKEVDEKKQFGGIPFQSKPNYSILTFQNTTPKKLNVYRVNSKVQFTSKNYSLPNTFVTVTKGVIRDFTCPIENDDIFQKIREELDNTFPTKEYAVQGTTYRGSNVNFILLGTQQGKYLYMTLASSESIPDMKDETGIINLVGGKISDPMISRFIASIPGKSERKTYSGAYSDIYEVTWPKEGIMMAFKKVNGDTLLQTLYIHFVKDDVYWNKTPFNGAFEVPFGLNANTTERQMQDMFGPADATDRKNEMNYKVFKIKTTFLRPQKSYGEPTLGHLTIGN
jgi:hypothetical protein